MGTINRENKRGGSEKSEDEREEGGWGEDRG